MKLQHEAFCMFFNGARNQKECTMPYITTQFDFKTLPNKIVLKNIIFKITSWNIFHLNRHSFSYWI